MGLTNKSIIVFNNPSDTGVDEIPHNSYIQITDNGSGNELLLFVFDVSTYTGTSTVQNLLDNTAHYHKLLEGGTTFGSSVGAVLDIDDTPELSTDLECGSYDITDINFKHRYHQGIDLNSLVYIDGSSLVGPLNGSNYFYYAVSEDITINLPDIGTVTEGKKILLRLSNIGTSEIDYQPVVNWEEDVYPSSTTNNVMLIEFILINGEWYGKKILFEPKVGWDLSTITYEQQSPALTNMIDSTGITFKPDGSIMYVIDSVSNSSTSILYQYNLNIPWDISTVEYSGNSYIMAPLTEYWNEGLSISTDGRNVYSVGGEFDDIYQYTLSTPWDISTATFYTSFNVIGGYVAGMFLSADGTKIYITDGGVGNNVCRQYNLSIPWDLNSTTVTSTMDFGTTNRIESMFISTDGTMAFFGDKDSPFKLYEYTLSTPWDISTGVYNRYVSLNDQINGLYIDDTGTHLYSGIGTSYVKQYKMG